MAVILLADDVPIPFRITFAAATNANYADTLYQMVLLVQLKLQYINYVLLRPF